LEVIEQGPLLDGPAPDPSFGQAEGTGRRPRCRNCQVRVPHGPLRCDACEKYFEQHGSERPQVLVKFSRK
jgi:hypothetical protein